VEGVVASVDFFREEDDVSVVGREDDAVAVEGGEVFGGGQAGGDACGADGDVGDVAGVVDGSDPGVFEAEGFVIGLRGEGGVVFDVKVDAVGASGQAEVGEAGEKFSLWGGDDSGVG